MIGINELEFLMVSTFKQLNWFLKFKIQIFNKILTRKRFMLKTHCRKRLRNPQFSDIVKIIERIKIHRIALRLTNATMIIIDFPKMYFNEFFRVFLASKIGIYTTPLSASAQEMQRWRVITSNFNEIGQKNRKEFGNVQIYMRISIAARDGRCLCPKE